MGFMEIVGRRLVGGERHEHVVEVECEYRDGARRRVPPTSVMRWLEEPTNVAVVYEAGRRRRYIVGVFRGQEASPHLRTYTQAGWEDHLLALPDLPARDAEAGGPADRFASAQPATRRQV